MMHVTQVKIMNPVRALRLFGQSVWLDYIRRSFITSGELQRLIAEEGVGGVTSNPAIFEKAITGSSDYAEVLSALRREPGLDAKARYERVAIEDIQSAADFLQPVYARTKRRDGYVSLEVSPHLAHDTRGTLDEATRLWEAVGRDNLMIKVPATPAGIPAIVQLLGRGINVNVTLLFAQETYESVAEAYLTGLEQLATRGATSGAWRASPVFSSAVSIRRRTPKLSSGSRLRRTRTYGRRSGASRGRSPSRTPSWPINGIGPCSPALAGRPSRDREP